MLGHPGLQRVGVILLLRKDRDETRKVVGRDMAEQDRGRHPLIETSTGEQDGQQQAPCIDQHMPLAPVDFLAAIVPRSGPPLSVVLSDWLSMHAALGVGARPAATRVRSRKALTSLVHVPSSRPRAK
jgi:hypothetical protein